jgi:CheY-like chemotaxis protein
MRRIRAAVGSTERRPRAIVVTGRADERERTRCLAAGFDAFLTKPVDPILLSDVVAWLTRDVTPNGKEITVEVQRLERLR